MPGLVVREPNDVLAPSHTPRAVAVLEQRRLYEGFIQGLDGNTGELELSEGNAADYQVRVRQAATRLALELEIWDEDDNLNFKTVTDEAGREGVLPTRVELLDSLVASLAATRRVTRPFRTQSRRNLGRL